jgi:hypothetical protein
VIVDNMYGSSTAADLAATLGSAKTARAWLAEANENTTDDLSAQQALLAVSVALEAHLPGAAKRGSIERALAAGNWQTAYDAAMTLPLGGNAALARVLLVADGLRAAGAPDASLDILGRTLDPYAQTPEVYSALGQVLATLGRSDDAEAALTLMREYAATTEAVPA